LYYDWVTDSCRDKLHCCDLDFQPFDYSYLKDRGFIEPILSKIKVTLHVVVLTPNVEFN
jgi:hypothetical protein